jgi:hypothetical protein
MASNRTFYPTFRVLSKRLALYIAKHGATMTIRTGITGSSFQTDLGNLQAALNQVLANWPDYTEPQ